MADPIPAANAALLAAQAKAGQAGVDAYKAAQAELQNQRKTAVQQAMQEAALRGAPTGAVGSIASTITGPYDQAIAGMSQASSAYQASMAARDRRMADYNQAVLATRSYIPQQVEMAVAPIRAQGEYNVRQEQIRGQQSVAEIEANTDLTRARMDATAQAAAIKAAQDAAAASAQDSQLSQGELSAMLGNEARDILGATGDVSNLIGANLAALRQNAGQIGRRVTKAASAAQRKVAGDAFWRMQAAAYTAKAVAEDRARQRSLAELPPSTIAAMGGGPPVVGSTGYQPPRRTAPPGSQPGDVVGYTHSGVPIYSDQLPAGGDLPPWVLQPSQMPGMQSPSASLINLNPNRYAAANAAISALQAQASRLPAQNQAILARTLATGLAGIRQAANQYATVDPATGNRILLTPGQVQGLDPFTRNVVQGALQQGTMISPSGFSSIVMGDPTRDIEKMATQTAAGEPVLTGGGVGSRYSSDVVRAALQEAGRRLVDQGYDIDPAELANAMPNEVPSVYNYLAKASGQPTSEQEYAAAVRNQAGITKGKTTASKADEAAARDELASRYGTEPPDKLGDPLDILEIVTQPETKPDFEQAQSQIQDMLDNWKDNEQPTHERLLRKLRTAGVSARLAEIALWSVGF